MRRVGVLFWAWGASLAGSSGCDGGATAAVCSDGVVGSGEECDDGNLLAGDGCDPACRLEAGADAGADAGPDAVPDEGLDAEADAASDGPLVIAGGDVSGSWCGPSQVNASVTVPAGETLEICAGSVVTFAPEAAMTVAGTLALRGTAGARVTLTSSAQWPGLVVSGTLDGAFADFRNAARCVDGRRGSAITIGDSTFEGCDASIRVASGGTFDRTVVRGGAALGISGGILRMTDSSIDLGHRGTPPDCTNFDAGGAVLDHVRIGGCHCPLHVNRTTEEVTVTNSVFDEAAVPVMIAQSTATFHGNHFLGSGPGMMDIGGSIAADVAGNYWGGGAPDISTSDPGQFTGTADYSTGPIPGAGPR
ncbi:MAG: hypothetical protein HY907_23040 [Deltaproteobacteria bacterium]|nr:hypothetical protein [Deltaproteobacteria bacterium]